MRPLGIDTKENGTCGGVEKIEHEEDVTKDGHLGKCGDE